MNIRKKSKLLRKFLPMRICSGALRQELTISRQEGANRGDLSEKMYEVILSDRASDYYEKQPIQITVRNGYVKIFV